jgi:hypothetical protein
MSQSEEIRELVVSLVGDLTGLDKAAEQADQIMSELNTLREESISNAMIQTAAEKELADAIGLAEVSTSKVASVVAELTAEYEFLKEVFGDVNALVESGSTYAAEYIALQGDLAVAYEKQAEDLKKMFDAADKASKSQAELKENIESLQKGLTMIPGPAGAAARQFMSMRAALASFWAVAAPILPVLLGIAAAVTAIVGPIVILNKVTKEAIATMEQLDPTIKKATALGDNVGDIQSLSFALKEIAGMDPGKTEMTLTRLQRTVGMAIDGGKQGAKIFKEMGLELQDIANKTPTEQFRAVAGAMTGIDSQAVKTRLAMRLFGREGMAVVGALSAQADALEEAESFARRMGLTITQEQGKAIEAANDAMGRVKSMIEGFQIQIAAELAPIIKVIADEILAWMPAAGEAKNSIRGIVNIMTVLLGHTLDVGKAMLALQQAMSGNLSIAADLFADIINNPMMIKLPQQLAKARRDAADAAAHEAKNVDLAAEAAKKANIEAVQTVENLQKELDFRQQMDQVGGITNRQLFDMKEAGVAVELLEEFARLQADINDIEEKRKKNEADRLKDLDNQNKATARAKQLMDGLITPQEKIVQRAKEIQDLMAGGFLLPEEGDRLFDQLQHELDAIMDKTKDMTKEADAFWNALNGTGTEFGLGREGLESALKDLRAERMANLDVNLSAADARSIIDQTGRDQRSGKNQVDQKLLTVLELLERTLNKPPNPNALDLDVISSLELTSA